MRLTLAINLGRKWRFDVCPKFGIGQVYWLKDWRISGEILAMTRHRRAEGIIGFLVTALTHD